VPRVGDQFGCRAGLDDLAAVHHGNAVGALGRQAEIVRDQQHGGAHVGGKLSHLVEDEPLHGHVKRRGGLVGQQHLGTAGQGHGDQHSLAHAAGELVRVLTEPHLRIADARLLEQPDRLVPCGLPAGPAVDFKGLDDLGADPHHRVEVGHRVLGDHADHVAADGSHGLVARGGDVEIADHDGAAGDAAVLGEQPVHGRGKGGLARAGLADDRDGLPGRHVEADMADRFHRALGGREGDGQIPDGQDRLMGGSGRDLSHRSSAGVAWVLACSKTRSAASSRTDWMSVPATR
jgi:hypothetical protein